MLLFFVIICITCCFVFLIVIMIRNIILSFINIWKLCVKLMLCVNILCYIFIRECVRLSNNWYVNEYLQRVTSNLLRCIFVCWYIRWSKDGRHRRSAVLYWSALWLIKVCTHTLVSDSVIYMIYTTYKMYYIYGLIMVVLCWSALWRIQVCNNFGGTYGHTAVLTPSATDYQYL